MKIDVTGATTSDTVNVNGTAVYPPVTPPIPPIPPVNDIQAAVNALPAGGVLQLPAGTYPGFNLLAAQNNITVRAMGAVVFTSSINAQNKMGFVLDGWAAGKPLINMQSFGVNNSGSTNAKVVGLIFTGSQRNFGDNGWAVGLSDSKGAVIGNCMFTNAGAPLGTYNFNGLRIEGNDFINCTMPLAADTWAPNGTGLVLLNNYISGMTYGGPESAGETTAQLVGFLVQGNVMVDFGGQAFIGALSFVPKGTCTGKISGNYLDRGPLSSTHYPGVGTSPSGYWNDTPSGYSESLEVFSTQNGGIEIANNTFLNYNPGMCVHNYPESGGPVPNIHDNHSWNCQQSIAGITPLGSAPSRPPHPPRMAWPR